MSNFYLWEKRRDETNVIFDNQLENYARFVQYRREFEEARRVWCAYKSRSLFRREDFAVWVAAFLVDSLFSLPVYDGLILVNLKTKEVTHVFNQGFRYRRNGWQVFSNVYDWKDPDVSIISSDVGLFFITVITKVLVAFDNLQSAVPRAAKQ